MEKEKLYTSGTLIIRSKTNNGEYGKQYFCIAGHNKEDSALIIKKFVLSNDEVLYRNCNFKPVKKFKDKTLYFIGFSIKIDTLSEALKWMYEILN